MCWIIRHVLTFILLIGCKLLMVLCACELGNRIKRVDTEVTVSQTDQPCTVTFTARNNKQVVVVMYDTEADCVERATVAIYDGININGILLTNLCTAKPWSFASRTGSLTLTPVAGKPLRNLSLDAHAVDTVKTYTEQTETIRSDRFPGYIYGMSNVMTSPNNFHAIYKITAGENVTISAYFLELFVQTAPGGTCADYVIIHGISPKLCGEYILPSNVTTVTNELIIEFFTDSLTTYTGFEVGYVACFDKRNDSNKPGEFQVPMYQLEEKMRCFLDIQLTEKRRVIIDMAVNSMMNYKTCKDIIRIIADGTDITDVYLSGCRLNTNMSLDLSLTRLLRIIVVSENRNDFVRGSYKTEKVLDCTRENALGDASPSKLCTTATLVSVHADSEWFRIHDGPFTNLSNGDRVLTTVPSDSYSDSYRLRFFACFQMGGARLLCFDDQYSVSVSVILTLVIAGILLAILYKREVISLNISCNADNTYEDPLQKTQGNQYSDPSSQHGDDMFTEYQNETIGKGTKTSSEPTHHKYEQRRDDSNPEAIYETAESGL